MSFPSGTPSLFAHTFDIAVYGAGYAGFSAARELAAQGRSVLLVESSGDLLWESSQALENRMTGDGNAWQKWLQGLEKRQGLRGCYFDVPLAEILAAYEVRQLNNLQTLLYALPVEAHVSEGLLTGVTVATKSGPRLLRARQWIDASESAVLAQLSAPGEFQNARSPATCWKSVVIYSASWNEAEAGLETFLKSHPECEWHESARPEGRRLSWSSEEDVSGLIRELREACPGVALFFSHVSAKPFPVYAASLVEETGFCPENLLAFNPAARKAPVRTLGDRFEWGYRAAREITERQVTAPHRPAFAVALPAPGEEVLCDVLVVGAGTAGAVAAVAAARKGVQTVVIESGFGVGGMGTDGGITGYFHGGKGGIQDEVDQLTAALSSSLTGRPGIAGVGWHHVAKKQAFAQLFRETRVRFIPETVLCGVECDADGKVGAVLTAQEGKVIRIRAKTFIDSTGDGDLCALAGAEFTMGRPGDGRSLAFSQSAFSLAKSESGYRHHSWNFDAGWVDPSDPEDLSRARLQGLALYLTDTWNANNRPIAIAPLLGLRQSRHISTEAELSLGHLIEHRSFPDAIGLTAAVSDTHSVDFEFESDEALFYLWVCRCFRHRLYAELPYRMMIPRKLGNVWIACRAAGVSVEAAYCVRMQRDMQRLGEAAGLAAALSLPQGGGSRQVDLNSLQSELAASGAKQPLPESSAPLRYEDILSLLDEGKSGIHLWTLYRQCEGYQEDLLKRLSHTGTVSFYAAAILAMHGDGRAEARLLAAVRAREVGPEPDEKSRGAFGQTIDIPFWLLATALLRICGTEKTLPVLREILEEPMPFNVRTTVALTLERLLQRLGPLSSAIEILRLLEAQGTDDSLLPPSRSLWKTLHREEQRPLGNVWTTDTRQDHSWQMQGILTRIHHRLAGKTLPERKPDLELLQVSS